MATCANCGTKFTAVNENHKYCSIQCLDDADRKKSIINDHCETSLAVDGGGKRFNTGKLPIELVPTSAMYAIADALGYGASKYEANNWRRGMKWSIPYSCAMRHLLKWFEGEDRDEESGREHLSHVMANVAMLIEYAETCKDLDDRYTSARKYDTFKSTKAEELDMPKIDDKELQEMAEYFEPDVYDNGRT